MESAGQTSATNGRRGTPLPSLSAEGQVINVQQAGSGLAVGALVCGIAGLILGLVPTLFTTAVACEAGDA